MSCSGQPSTLLATPSSAEIVLTVLVLTTVPIVEIADSVAVADNLATSATKAVVDTLSPIEAGTVRCQGYAPPDYFADDYVGSSATF